MEELRPVVADRLALTLINRRQVTKEHFEERRPIGWLPHICTSLPLLDGGLGSEFRVDRPGIDLSSSVR
jgi:hypothetical protein